MNLPQIGKRMAELIVAELAGKVKEFATSYDSKSPSIAGTAPARRSEVEEDAIAALMAPANAGRTRRIYWSAPSCGDECENE